MFLMLFAVIEIAEHFLFIFQKRKSKTESLGNQFIRIENFFPINSAKWRSWKIIRHLFQGFFEKKIWEPWKSWKSIVISREIWFSEIYQRTVRLSWNLAWRRCLTSTTCARNFVQFGHQGCQKSWKNLKKSKLLYGRVARIDVFCSGFHGLW